jgi:hypothetical protein
VGWGRLLLLLLLLLLDVLLLWHAELLHRIKLPRNLER